MGKLGYTVLDRARDTVQAMSVSDNIAFSYIMDTFVSELISYVQVCPTGPYVFSNRDGRRTQNKEWLFHKKS